MRQPEAWPAGFPPDDEDRTLDRFIAEPLDWLEMNTSSGLFSHLWARRAFERDRTG